MEEEVFKYRDGMVCLETLGFSTDTLNPRKFHYQKTDEGIRIVLDKEVKIFPDTEWANILTAIKGHKSFDRMIADSESDGPKLKETIDLAVKNTMLKGFSSYIAAILVHQGSMTHLNQGMMGPYVCVETKSNF